MNQTSQQNSIYKRRCQTLTASFGFATIKILKPPTLWPQGHTVGFFI
ncbi:MAG: hypothetical protein V1688_01250 [bacterium]